jgi:hypothetical protein
MSELALAVLIPGATTALMVAFAANNRRTGWRRRAEGEERERPSGVWLLARQLHALRGSPVPDFRPFPPLPARPGSPPEEASLAQPLANLQQSLEAAAAEPTPSACPDLSLPGQVARVE